MWQIDTMHIIVDLEIAETLSGVLCSISTMPVGGYRLYYKLQAYRTRKVEPEFCTGGQIHIDNLPYKGFIAPFLSCTKA